MGTNYYAVLNRPTTQSPIHIGKSSCGWLFLFHRTNERLNDPPIIWNTYTQVKDWLMRYCDELNTYTIVDEYDNLLTVKEFFQIVDDKQNDPSCLSNKDNFRYADNVDGYRFSDSDFC